MAISNYMRIQTTSKTNVRVDVSEIIGAHSMFAATQLRALHA